MARAPHTESTGSLCSACGGDVVKEVHNVPSVPRSEMVMGPGGRHNFHEETSFHCRSCGLMYKFPPKRPKPLSVPVVRDPLPGESLEVGSRLLQDDSIDYSRLFNPEGDRFILPVGSHLPPSLKLLQGGRT